MIHQWRDLETWILTEDLSQQNSQFPLTPLREVIRQRREALTLNNSLEDWTPITVHLTGEISVRNRTEPYKGSNFAAYPGDIVFSKIDARNGAIGVLPLEIEKAIVTAEFPVFTANTERLDGGFLKLLLRTGNFIKALRQKASGTSGRRRITPDAFLDLSIPLPTIDQQKTIVALYYATFNQATDIETEAAEIEAKAIEVFETVLGAEPPPPLPDISAFVASFMDLEQWNYDGVLRSTLQLEAPEPNFTPVELGKVGKVSYGLQKSPANRPTSHSRPYLRVANVQRWRLELEKIKMINVPDEEMPKYRLEEGDVLLCEGNSADLVGRGAIWHNEIPDCVHQNHVLRVRLDQSKALPEFVLSVINSRYGKAYFLAKAKRTTNLASINSKEVGSFPLPLPPIDIQKALVESLFEQQQVAKSKRKEAEQARARAWLEFETAVYADENEESSV